MSVRAPALLVLAAWAAGCGVPSSLRSPCVPITAAAPPPGPHEGVHLPGQRVAVVLRLLPPPSCEVENLPLATGVTLEVTGPDGQVPDAEATLPRWRDTRPGYWETTVSFTPNAAGPWHVLADIGPGLGLVQRPVWVAVDRSAESPQLQSVPDRVCETTARTRSGALVCFHSFDGASVQRDGARLATWEAADARVVGDTIWRRTSDGWLRPARLLPGDVLDESAAPVAYSTYAWAPGEDALTVAFIDRVRRYRFTGGVLQAEAEAVVRDRTLVHALASSPDSVLISTAVSWARLPLPYGGEDLSWTLGEGAAHQAPDGLWLVDATGTSFHFVPADPKRPHARFTAPEGFSTTASDLGFTLEGERPLLFPRNPTTNTLDRTQVLVPVVDGATVQLHWFVAQTSAQFIDVRNGELHARQGPDHFFWKL